MDWDWDDPRRQSSLLTPALRRYLVDEEFREDVSHSYASQLRSRARERLASGLLDLRLLLHHYPDEELRRVMDEEFTIPREGINEDEEEELDEIRINADDDEPIEGGFADGIGLIYRHGLADEDEEDWSDDYSDYVRRQGFAGPHAIANHHLAGLVKVGVERALSTREEYADARVEMDLIDHGDLDRGLDLSEQPENALRYLLARGEITPEEYSGEIQRRKEELSDKSGSNTS